ncbi:uncharacterized protein LOC119835111 [Zerene cesonia]|uniref:uncharacterized protein LOC119835111 n=1 Tax=Zerene cesonia TaxID=33412 RepID=UPI0018E58547|nr:uncharacterized protein LOC119835111 [Zerene cesonia]
MSSREKAILTEFIKLYKNLSCLWDTTNSTYHNKEARTHAYNILLEKYKEYDEEATFPILRKRIDNMRTCTKREYRKVLAAKMKGEDYKPTLWYYKLFSFLFHPEIDAKSDAESETYNSDDCTDTHEELLFHLQSDNSIPAKKQRLSEIYIKEDGPNENSINRSEIENTSSHDLEEAASFGRTIGLQLNKLDRFQRIIAEKLISDVIFSARLNKLSAESTIHL